MVVNGARLIVLAPALVALALLLGACGDDDSTRYPPATATSTPTPPTNSLMYDFGSIEGAVSAIQGSVATIQGLLDEGGRCVRKLSPIWGGAASEAYLSTQQQWDATAAALNNAAQDLANKVAEAGSSMQDTEQGVGDLFSYAFGSRPQPIRFAGQQTDAQALSQAAAEFDRVSSDLKGAISQVDATAGDLAGVLSGPAGYAAQAAFARFSDAASKQIQLLNAISDTINRAGGQYQGADEDGASSLQGSMGF